MRDYQGNLTLTDRNYFLNDAVYPSLEYPASPLIRGISYLRGSTMNVTVRIENQGPYDLVGWITFDDARLASPGPNTYDSITDTWSNPVEHRSLTIAPFLEYLELPSQSYVDLEVQISGTPNFIALGDIQVEYDMPLWRESDNFYGNNGTLGSYDSWERLFLVDATPIAPQAVPWADYLEYTCRWAFGHTGNLDVKTWMTRGMHYSLRSANSRVLYVPEEPSFYPIGLGANPPYDYNLGRFTNDLDDPEMWTILDCRDFAGGMQVALNQHGLEAIPHYLTADFGQAPPWPFWTNLLCRAGFDSTDPENYHQEGFNFHVVANESWLERYLDASSSYRHDPYGAVYNNPATNWTLPDYWQHDIGTRYSGLVAAAEDDQYNLVEAVPLYDPVPFPVTVLSFDMDD